MSVLKGQLYITFKCNGCGDTLDTGKDDFSEALSVMRDNGWVSSQDENGRWGHYCEECG